MRQVYSKGERKMKKPLYQSIALAIDAYKTCKSRNNTEWETRWEDTLHNYASTYLPHGSGFDNGCIIDIDKSTPDRIVIHADFHNMNENGFYDGWGTHNVIIKPSLFFGFTLTITGRDYNGFKSYAYELFQECLSTEVAS
jgi:hypothetical protein